MSTRMLVRDTLQAVHLMLDLVIIVSCLKHFKKRKFISSTEHEFERVRNIVGQNLFLFLFYTICCDTNKDSLMFSFWSIGSPSSDIYPGGGVSVLGILLTLPTLTLAESIIVVLPGICWLSVASIYGVCCKLIEWIERN